MSSHSHAHARCTRATSHPHPHAHGHSHGLVHESIKRSHEGVRAVALALVVLGLTAPAQAAVFALSGSVALLADLIHNAGDAGDRDPAGHRLRLAQRPRRTLGRPRRRRSRSSSAPAWPATRRSQRLITPADVDHLGALAAAGALGFAGNWLAARIRARAGRRLDSPALVADGAHARADAYVSLAVVASAAVVALGVPIADPLIGLAITLVILRITRDSLRTVHG